MRNSLKKTPAEMTLVYFHSEGVIADSDSNAMVVASANLLDFFVYVSGLCKHSIFYSVKRSGNNGVELTLPAHAECIVVPIQVGGPKRVVRSLFQIMHTFFFNNSVKCNIAEADISISVGLDGLGLLAGLVRFFCSEKRHAFIVRGNRQLTVRQSSRGLLSKNFALLRIAIYKSLMIFMVNRNRADLWFQGELQRDHFRGFVADNRRESLQVLNAVLRDMPVCKSRPESSDLVFTGRLTIEKGLLELVEAVRLLRNEGRIVSLTLIGSGPDEKKVRDAVERYTLEDQVSFAGFISDVGHLGSLVASSRLFVLPSYTEGLPRSMLESMWIGTPVLVTPVGGIPYVIEDGKNGFLVEAKSPEALAEKIRMVLDTGAEEMSALVLRAREVAAQHSFPARAPVFLSIAGRPGSR